jgi:hypothetical protein
MRSMVVAVVGLLACGGGGSDEEGCGEVFSGTAFTLDEGTATVTGHIEWPEEVEEGMNLEVLVGDAGMSAGVIAENVFDTPQTCGGGIDYEILQLEPGTYTIETRISDLSGDEPVLKFQGFSDEITVDTADVSGVDITAEAASE